MKKFKIFTLGLLTGLSIMFIGLCIETYIGLRMVGEEITCDYRYVGGSYKGTVLAQKGYYIYLSGTSEVRLDCTIDEDKVDENTPLCGTYVPFNGPLDTSNMNCYKGDKDIEGKLKAFKEQEDAAKKEDDKYYACDLRADKMVEFYNSCETIDCATYRIRSYLKDTCPSATIK